MKVLLGGFVLSVAGGAVIGAVVGALAFGGLVSHALVRR